MQARDVFLAQLMQGPKQFLVPIFQRTYSWKEVHCAQLYKDIIQTGKSEHIQSHFIGSIVLISNQQTTASIPQWQVIDGQQRLTTTTLLISAMIYRAKELGLETIAATPLDGITEYYLTNSYGDGDSRYKLLLTKSDKSSLCALIDHQSETDAVTGKMLQNYKYFIEMFVDSEAIESVYQGLQKLKVVEVVLQTGQDDPQAIFESLNSTGVDLSQADLIRNYVLMKQTHDVQTKLYEEIWYPMEQLFGSAYANKFDRFSQDLLTLVTRSNSLVKAGDIYTLFKQWFSEQVRTYTVEEILNNIHSHAQFYAAYSLLKEKDSSLRDAFSNLRTLVEVATPVIIRLYQLYETEHLSKDDFLKAVRLLESYVLRRSVCDMQTRSLGNIFAALAQKITTDKPLESLSVAIARFSKNSRFPNNTEFFEALLHKDLYDSRICKFVLDRLENDSKEKIDTNKFSIEHIMPRNENMRPEWRAMLGDNWQSIQQAWLHRLGNLTLTGYNPEYSDKDFQTKKSIVGGFDESPLRLNRDMRESSQWTEREMEARARRLAEQSINLWPMLQVSSELISEYELEEYKRLSYGKTTADVPGFNSTTTTLFSQLESYIKGIGDDITLITGKKNLTFYTLEPFLQAIPRKNYLALVMALEYDQLTAEIQGLCNNTSDWSFIVNATLRGVYCELHSENDLDKLDGLIRLSYEEALS